MYAGSFPGCPPMRSCPSCRIVRRGRRVL